MVSSDVLSISKVECTAISGGQRIRKGEHRQARSAEPKRTPTAQNRASQGGLEQSVEATGGGLLDSRFWRGVESLGREVPRRRMTLPARTESVSRTYSKQLSRDRRCWLVVKLGTSRPG